MLFQEIINSRQTRHGDFEPTFMTFVREGTLYTQPDVKTWYLQALHATHNNVHGWEFVGEKVREFLETFCDYKVEEVKNDSNIKSNLISISSDTGSNKSKSLVEDKFLDNENENNDKNDNGSANSDIEKKEWIVVND